MTDGADDTRVSATKRVRVKCEWNLKKEKRKETACDQQGGAAELSA